MGLLVSKLSDLLHSFSEENVRLLMLGLDSAGKTTILYKMKLNETVFTIPTIGFNVETVSPCKGLSFTVWDVGGQDRIRALWRHYYQNTAGLLFIVDSADRERLDEARYLLFQIHEEQDMYNVPVVVIANKQDLPGAMSVSEVAEGLRLSKLEKRNWHIQGACALSGDGIFDAMLKMKELVKNRK